MSYPFIIAIYLRKRRYKNCWNCTGTKPESRKRITREYPVIFVTTADLSAGATMSAKSWVSEWVSVLDITSYSTAIRRYSRSDRVVRGGPSEVKPIRSGWASCLDVTAIAIFRALVVSSTLPLNLAFSERFLSINNKVRSSVKALTFPILHKSISIDLNMKQISTLLWHRFDYRCFVCFFRCFSTSCFILFCQRNESLRRPNPAVWLSVKCYAIEIFYRMNVLGRPKPVVWLSVKVTLCWETIEILLSTIEILLRTIEILLRNWKPWNLL